MFTTLQETWRAMHTQSGHGMFLVHQAVEENGTTIGWNLQSSTWEECQAAMTELEAILYPVYTVEIPRVGWDQDDQSVLVEQRIDDDTFLSVDIVEPEPDVYAVRHAVIVRSEDNTEVRNVSPREIQLVQSESKAGRPRKE